MTTEPVLFVDDEEHLRLAAEQTLALADLEVVSLPEAEAALGRVSRNFPGVLVTDIRMRGMDGLTLMHRCLEIDPEFPVILITGHGDVELAVQTMRDGAYDFLEKPYAPARLVDTVRRALDKRRLTLENRQLRSQVGGRDAIEARLSGRSAVMVALRQQIRAVAVTSADVLIVGATGTGKEVAARALHRAGPRSDAPFVQINCAALPADLIESELFGHEAGAFAGATRPRYGKFEHARGGTVFLDEIDSLPGPLQAKLLHAIQNRAITRLGSNDTIPLDVRFIAASKRDLADAAARGEFRSDLLYRLNVVTLRMPDLAARREDIPRLFLHLVQEAAARCKRPAPDVPGTILRTLPVRDWPGNVRELRNVAERFVLGLDLDIGETPGDGVAGLADQVAAFEKSLIAGSIAAHGGRLKDTYESLGISRKGLYEKMQKHGLSRQDFVDEE
ncbi:Fis family transcriptional regulator [Meridianimarinicoccus roseus]|uniref:Nif-specific regulatory protein n=1 Tax=Meridianimarinicoccus roseus TaxID=2072018 RepID=A0A2V2LGC3_9RHOB|nr:sigma-54 dependent transcriptional regulator [Meridianimarinicoccus roseus]PWR02237.1 Fis family transcriptional regulator [Meridianimarinicoccus roseus]